MKKRAKDHHNSDLSEKLATKIQEGVFIAWVALAVFLFLALASYEPEDPGWSYLGTENGAENIVGKSGAVPRAGSLVYIFMISVRISRMVVAVL